MGFPILLFLIAYNIHLPRSLRSRSDPFLDLGKRDHLVNVGLEGREFLEGFGFLYQHFPEEPADVEVSPGDL